MSTSDSQPRVELIDLRAQSDRLGKRLDRALARVLDHGQFILGPEVTELETALARRTGARQVVTCSSGTDALLLVLMAWGVGPGDAVFVPAFTFPATAEVVVLLGATPVFVDVDADTYNLDPRRLEQAVGSLPPSLEPAAVIAVDLYGLPADYETIRVVAEGAGMRVLADAAQSFGARIGDRAVGTLADATATSFFPAKPLGCYGDGGAIFVDDEDAADTLRSLRVHGRGSAKYDVQRIGINGRLDTLQAAVLLAKLEIFSHELEARARIARDYSDALHEANVVVPLVPEGRTSAWAQYTVRVANRDAVRQRLAGVGVSTAVYYPRPLHQQPAYAHGVIGEGGLPASEQLVAEVLSLPLHPYLSADDQARVIEALESGLCNVGGASAD